MKLLTLYESTKCDNSLVQCLSVYFVELLTFLFDLVDRSRFCLELSKGGRVAWLRLEDDHHESVTTIDSLSVDFENPDPGTDHVGNSLNCYDIVLAVAMQLKLLTDAFTHG